MTSKKFKEKHLYFFFIGLNSFVFGFGNIIGNIIRINYIIGFLISIIIMLYFLAKISEKNKGVN